MMGEEGRGERRGGFGGRGRGGDRGDREGGYRRRDAGEGKEGGAPGDFAPQLYVSHSYTLLRHCHAYQRGSLLTQRTAVVDSVVAVALLPRRKWKASDCDRNGGHDNDSHNRCWGSGNGTLCMLIGTARTVPYPKGGWPTSNASTYYSGICVRSLVARDYRKTRAFRDTICGSTCYFLSCRGTACA
jgi:hypothetical protein